MIELKSLSNTPDYPYCNTHYYCDYIELLALVDGDDGTSQHDVYDRFYENEKVTQIGEADGASSIEDWRTRIQLWFTELEVRSNNYLEYYPFYLESSRIKLKSDLTVGQKLYLGLLLCSSLSYISKGRNIFTDSFELVSYFAMKAYLPETSEVHIFGTSSFSNKKFIGSLKDKVTSLSIELNCKIKCEDKTFIQYDNGDGGVDIVAWVPFKGDMNQNRKQIFFGQSAIGKNWSNKQGSVDRMDNYLTLPKKVQNVLYISYDLRDSDRDFSEDGKITTDIIFDRQRILELVDADAIFDTASGSNLMKAVEFSILEEEDII
ncbi:hypothetical protein [Ferrimonas kyonanensis]|uniref:hypothetical protein n=1 Tax=Ferrimonas kyonanensis TaxID=364763 RepID=UPI0004142BB8|nr:hypothetical protein [Ferrimonas kyonanensis]